MRTFLRYNSRHCMYFPRGFKNKWLPQLNPIMSSSHGAPSKRHPQGRPCNRLWEPLWMFRLRQRLFAFDSRQRCGRRGESIIGRSDVALPDTWDIGPDDNRTCSYCGSIHFDDLMAICKKTLTDDRYEVTSTDKRYKYYVKQPGVHNASEGAIKYYTVHTPEGVTDEQKKLFGEAVRTSHERFMQKYYPKKVG